MTPNSRPVLAGAAVLALLLAAMPATAAEGADAWSETTNRLRTVGVALYGWFTDTVRPGLEVQGLETLPLADMPAASADQIEEWLVPDYLESLPRVDGWGRPLEFYVAPEAEGEPYLAVRSAGANGVFDAGEYDPRGTWEGDPEDDLVWADGYFVRWPQPPSE